jgi:hypothetical protein
MIKSNTHLILGIKQLMQSNLFIPTKLRVGFVNRNDTFTGKLAYVIYYDEKGQIRKETSWDSWRDKNIPAIEIDNKPHAGFILNKGIKRWGHWGDKAEKVRVYDPRDFEFEIDIPNLLGILMHSDVSKRDITQECVYAWANSKLVLLPTNSTEYQESVAYTEKQNKSISTKELQLGHTYSQRKTDKELMYVGYFPWYDSDHNNYSYSTQILKGKKHIFFDGSSYVIPSVATLAEDITGEHSDEYADIVDQFHKSYRGSAIVGWELIPHDGGSRYIKKMDDTSFLTVSYSRLFTYYGKEGVVDFLKHCSEHPYESTGKYYNVSNTKEGFNIYQNANKKFIMRENYNWHDNHKIRYRSDEFNSIISMMEARGYNPQAITQEQFNDVLIRLGYQSIRFILANDAHIELHNY